MWGWGPEVEAQAAFKGAVQIGLVTRVRRDYESSRLKGISGRAEALLSLGCPLRGPGIALAKGLCSKPPRGLSKVCGFPTGVQMEEGDDRGEQVYLAHGEHARMHLPAVRSLLGWTLKGPKRSSGKRGTERGLRVREEFSARG